MAQFAQDFSGYAIDTDLLEVLAFRASDPDWTLFRPDATGLTFTVVAGQTPVGDRYGQVNDHATTHVTIGYNPAGTPSDAEVLLLLRRPGEGETSLAMGAAIRGQGSDFNTDSAYYGQDRGTGSSFRQRRRLNGADAAVGAATYGLSADRGIWVWHRTRLSGTSLQSRWWEDGDPEPETWNVSGTDSDITGPGYVGWYHERLTEYDLAFIGIGTDGDPAPGPAAESDDPANLQVTIDGTTAHLSHDPSPMHT